jgi:hypothetical protein
MILKVEEKRIGRISPNILLLTLHSSRGLEFLSLIAHDADSARESSVRMKRDKSASECSPKHDLGGAA